MLVYGTQEEGDPWQKKLAIVKEPDNPKHSNGRKRTNIGNYSPYRSSGFKENQPFRVELRDKPKEIVAEVTKKKNSCHNCGSTDHYANNCPKAKKRIYAIEKVPEEESPTEDSESDSMGDAIGDQSDEEQDKREEFLVEYQQETPLEIQDIQLEAGMPQDTAIEKVPKEESPTGNSESDSMGDSIREQSDKDQDPREELLVE
ncbi:hypothetical protein O181_025434 [Austropuccinia psidii MF-1]|uniref:CCHC-type domain-containing protein n=1 Tax=Austropuccinia psidii MF-1 TaxID=1389203 RepID=A0A9Q3CKJ5_9BASI|nr:hypothetical protein [Austropuccinia psidii MF-1]